jgi:N-methylhydantoinase A/oxoprolinase/acetone carboxylase beta subunit
VDGNLIADVDLEEIKDQCEIIKQKGITSIVVIGVFSPIDSTHRQEERAAQVINDTLPGCHVVLSKEVANLGFLERENAAILNASILPFARKTIRSFQEPIKRLGLTCPVFLSQNDGTILSGEMASRLPIRTFSSGPTNSMRGAAYLAQGETNEAMMVADIGRFFSNSYQKYTHAIQVERLLMLAYCLPMAFLGRQQLTRNLLACA